MTAARGTRGGGAKKSVSPEDKASLEAIGAQMAYDRANAWALSVAGTPYGSTTPNLTEETTPYQDGHRHEYPNC